MHSTIRFTKTHFREDYGIGLNMTELNYEKQAQEYYSHSPVIIIGSGASAAFNISGMSALATHLIENVNTKELSDKEVSSWSKFCGLLKEGIDLESALHDVPLTNELTNKIVEHTWSLINPEDIATYYKSLNNRNFFALGQLIAAMFHSTNNTIDVITPNYDRLIEYACEQESFHHYSGFSHGYTRHLVDEKHLTAQRRVNIWKVHGSLDWFKTPIGEVIGLGHATEIPDGYQVQIVTPGINKYLTTQLEPFRSIISRADEALQKANSYLCIGFGFNDKHIQEKLVQKCVREKARITIITWKLTDAAKQFLQSEVPNYIAIERGDSDEKSVIYSSLADTPITVDADYWSLSGYLKLIL